MNPLIPTSVQSQWSLLEQLERTITCSICEEVMTDPVFVCDEMHTLDRHCIALWAKGHSTCPECRGHLSSLPFKVDRRARQNIEMYQAGIRQKQEKEELAKRIQSQSVPNKLSLGKLSGSELSQEKSSQVLESKRQDSELLTTAILKRSPLFEAIIRDDEKAVKHWIDHGGSVILEDTLGNNPIFYAKTCGIIEPLLRAGATIKCKPLQAKEHRQSLWDPISKSDLVTTKQLLEQGLGDINESNFSYGSVAWYQAVTKKCPIMVLLLIQAGANIEAKIFVKDLCQHSRFITPLQFALNRMFNDEIIEMLLRARADINTIGPGVLSLQKFSCGTNAFVEAVYQPCTPSTIRLFLQRGASVTTVDEKGITPLHNVRSLEIAKILVASGANLNAKTREGLTPLTTVSNDGQLEIARYLMSCGARFSGAGPLYAAVQRGNIKMLEFLIDAGMNINGDNSDLYGTPFGYACAVGDCRAEVVEFLLNRKANPNTPDKEGTTPLLRACMTSSIRVIQLLLDQGADPTTANKNGMTPLRYARESGKKDMLEMLQRSSSCSIQ